MLIQHVQAAPANRPITGAAQGAKPGAAQPRLPPATMPTPPAAATLHPVGSALWDWARAHHGPRGPEVPENRLVPRNGAKNFYDDLQRKCSISFPFAFVGAKKAVPSSVRHCPGVSFLIVAGRHTVDGSQCATNVEGEGYC